MKICYHHENCKRYFRFGEFYNEGVVYWSEGVVSVGGELYWSGGVVLVGGHVTELVGGHVTEPRYSFACVGALLERKKVENTFLLLKEVV